MDDQPIFDSNPDASPEEYAAFWGCDPAYDRGERQPGDGYLFYNFAVEGNDPDFLRRFIPAIERTIAQVKREWPMFTADDEPDLELLLEYVQGLLAEKSVSPGV